MRSATTILTLFLLLLAGCGGGSSTPDPGPSPDAPRVIAIFPEDLAARTGSSIRFIAQLDKPASSYTWDFGGGAIPTTATTATEFQPLVTLGAPGTYTATLTVCAAACAAPFSFQYTVTPNDSQDPGPHILSVSPTGAVGKRGEDVTFTAEIADGADSWEWFFGQGTTVPTSTLASPTMHLIRPGIFQGTLHATLSGGDEDFFEFAYEVLPGVANDPPVIDLIANENISACEDKHLAFSATVLSDFPNTYDWQFTGGIAPPTISTNSVARITTALPKGVGTGQLIVSNAFGSSAPKDFHYTIVDCPQPVLTEEFPANYPRGLHYLRLNLNGDTDTNAEFSLQAPGSVGSLSETQHEVQWRQPGDNTVEIRASRWEAWGAAPPAQFHFDNQLPGLLPTWQTALSLDTTDDSFAVSAVAFHNDRPVVVFYDHARDVLVYTGANIESPHGASDWTSHNIAGMPTTQGLIQFSSGDGRPVILVDTQENVRCLVSEEADPATTADWRTFNLEGMVPDLWTSKAVANAPDGRVMMLAKSRVSGAVSPLVIQTLVPHPTALTDIGVYEMFPSPPEALHVDKFSSELVHWRDGWFARVDTADGRREYLAGTTVGLPTSSAEWSLAGPVTASSDQQPIFGKGRLYATPSRLWMGQSFSSGIDTWDFTKGSFMWFTTADLPLVESDWQFAGEFPAVHTSFWGLGADIDGRLVLVSSRGTDATLCRALVDTPATGSDWCLVHLIDKTGFPFSSNESEPVRIATSHGRILIAQQGFHFDGTLDILQAELTW